eukprot:3936053-Rhodomonas_salina.3
MTLRAPCRCLAATAETRAGWWTLTTRTQPSASPSCSCPGTPPPNPACSSRSTRPRSAPNQTCTGKAVDSAWDVTTVRCDVTTRAQSAMPGPRY